MVRDSGNKRNDLDDRIFIEGLRILISLYLPQTLLILLNVQFPQLVIDSHLFDCDELLDIGDSNPVLSHGLTCFYW